jgi:beta-glucosidase
MFVAACVFFGVLSSAAQVPFVQQNNHNETDKSASQYSSLGGKPIPSHPLYMDKNAPTEARITALLEQMTLDEKIDALGTNPTIPRLGIVGTGHVEGLHGLALGGPGGWEGRNQTIIPTTTFPQARDLGQSWDPALLTKAAAEEAYETRQHLR